MPRHFFPLETCHRSIRSHLLRKVLHDRSTVASGRDAVICIIHQPERERGHKTRDVRRNGGSRPAKRERERDVKREKTMNENDEIRAERGEGENTLASLPIPRGIRPHCWRPR